MFNIANSLLLQDRAEKLSHLPFATQQMTIDRHQQSGSSYATTPSSLLEHMALPTLFQLSELMLQQDAHHLSIAGDGGTSDDGAASCSENEVPSPPKDPDGARYQHSIDATPSNGLAKHEASAPDPVGNSADAGDLLPTYNTHDENLLLQADLLSVESLNKLFFPHAYAKGQAHWIIVPPHILGIDTDFSLVSKKLQQFGLASAGEQQKEHARWSAMQAWERHMYEDRISLLMQQKHLLMARRATAAESLLSRRRKRGSLLTLDNSNNTPTNKNSIATPLRQLATQPSVIDHSLVSGVAATDTSSWPIMLQAANAMAASGLESDSDEVDSVEMIEVSRKKSKKSRVPASKCKCVRMKPPIPTKFRGSKQFMVMEVPDFAKLMNYPAVVQSDGTRSCVMCGAFCPTSGTGAKAKKTVATGRKPNNGALPPPSESGSSSPSSPHDQAAFIPTQNKGLCTVCDVMVWVVAESQMEIKWCKGCKNFRTWAAFGDKGHATKCVRCRERQREKYAAQKVAASLKKSAEKPKKNSSTPSRS